MLAGSTVGRSPWTLTTMSASPSGSTAERLEDAVGAGEVVGAGHDGLAAGAADRLGDPARRSATTTAADFRLHGAAPHVHDHRLAGDIGERLVRQAGRGHAGGNENDRGHAQQVGGKKSQGSCAYTGCLAYRAKRVVSAPEFLGSAKRNGAMDSFEFNKIAGAVLGTAARRHGPRHHRGLIYAQAKPAKPGYEIAVAEAPARRLPARRRGAVQSIGDASGERRRRARRSFGEGLSGCHTSPRGSRPKVGPNLYGVVGGPAAHMEGFKYSDAMHDRRRRGTTGRSTNLNKFLPPRA